jgi:lysophospholipase L1-like esterase
MMRRLPFALEKAALLLFGCAVAALASELLLRAIGYGEVAPQLSFGVRAEQALQRGYLVPDPVLFWKSRRGRDPQLERALNLVHPDAPIAPRDARARLIVLGDSCSRLAPDGLPYSASLQAQLGADWEVLNASVPGYSSHQGLRWLRAQLLDAKPDHVVIYFGWNDHWRTPGRTDREYERAMAPARPRLLALFWRRPDPPPFRVPLPEYRENLREMLDAVSEAGGRSTLVAAPHRFTAQSRRRYVEDGYLLEGDDALAIHRAYLDVVRELAGHTAVSVLGADTAFAAFGDSPALLRDDGIHLTEAGHRALAALLAEQLRTREGGDGSAAGSLLDAARRALAAENADAIKR